MRLPIRILCACAIGALAHTVIAQVVRPEGASRIVRQWDFEPIDGILVPVPENWFRGHTTPEDPRDGFPPWNEPALEEGTGVNGSWALKIPTEGGSAAIALARGVVPVFEEADYAVTAKVRTESLDVAGAVVAARLIDGDLRPIPGSEVRTRPLQTDGEWRDIHLQLHGDPTAQSLQIELLVLQPTEQRGHRRLAHEAIEQDLDGTAWVDDLVIYETPQIDMRINGLGNIIESPNEPELTMRVRDLAGEPLRVEVNVYGIDGRVIDTHRRPASAGGLPMVWSPTVRAYGWYRAVMDVRNEQGLVGRSFLDFSWLPEANDHRAEYATKPDHRRRFGVTLATRPIPGPDEYNGAPALLVHMLDQLHTGRVTIPAWSSVGAPEEPDIFDRLIEHLLEDGHDVAFVLDTLPQSVSDAYRVDRTDMFTVLGSADGRWTASLSRLLSRFGERIRTWQIGAEGSNEPYYRDDISAIVDRVREEIRGRVPMPSIRVPWRVEQPLDGTLSADERSLSLASKVRSNAISEYAEIWAGSWADESTTLVIELPDRDRFSPRDRVIELVRRVTFACAEGARRVVVPAPWRRHTDTGRSGETDETIGVLMPSPEFAAMRQLSDALSNREIVGELREIEGVRIFIAQGAKSSMLIAWNESADPSEAVISGYLGEGTILVRDPFGNATRSVPVDGEHRIGLRDMPVTIEGIDVELARFRAGLAIDPRFIQSEARKHYVDLVMTNPWDTAISGRIRFKEPESWKVSPRVLTFQLGPNETKKFELSLVLSGGEESGPRRVITEVELLALREYPVFEVPIQVEVGLDDIELRVSYRVVDGDVLVTAVVTNVSDRATTLRAVAVAPGQPSVHQSISGLAGGQTVMRTFLFEGAEEALRGQKVRVGLREQNGPGRLNRSLQMPE